MPSTFSSLAWATAPTLRSFLAAAFPSRRSASSLRIPRRPRHAPPARHRIIACEPPPTASYTASSNHVEAHSDGAPDEESRVAITTPRPPLRVANNADAPVVPEPPSLDVPGPTPLPVVGNALDILELPLSELMLRYARRHGPILSFYVLSDRLFLISDPVALSRVHATNSRNYLDRWVPPGFEILLYSGRLRGLVFSQRTHWVRHRRPVGTVFRSTAFLSSFVSVVREKTRLLFDDVWTPALAGRSRSQPLNVHHAMRMLTLDVIGSAVLGHEFGAIAAGEHPIEASLSLILRSVLEVIKSPLPLWRVMHTPGRAKIQAHLDRLQEIERGLINDRRARLAADPEGTNNDDVLAQLLRARDQHRDSDSAAEEDKDIDLIWDVHDIIFAGHETTASALAAALFLVSGSPRVLNRIREELDTVLPGGREPQLDDLPKLRYLDMVINESLRLYPPTALVGRVAKDSDVLGGYAIPAGASILMSPYVMGRLDCLWDNPLEFRPERFLPDQVVKRHSMTHTPFGAGPRVCLGARMATMEAKVVLAMIFSRFSFDRTTDELVADYNSTVSFTSGMDMYLVENRASAA